MTVSIRPARPGEAGLVLAFVRELAEYERLLDEVDATEAMIDAALFGPDPCVFCDIAEWDGAPVGFALSLANFSSFRGRHGIYLEDIFVPARIPFCWFWHQCGAAAASSRAALCRQRLDAFRVVGARLECAVDRVLQIARRRPDGRVDDLPDHRRRTRAARRRRGGLMGDRPENSCGRRRERRHRAGRRAAVAHQIGHAAFPRDDLGPPGGGRAQDLPVLREAATARAHQHRRCSTSAGPPDFASPGRDPLRRRLPAALAVARR